MSFRVVVGLTVSLALSACSGGDAVLTPAGQRTVVAAPGTAAPSPVTPAPVPTASPSVAPSAAPPSPATSPSAAPSASVAPSPVASPSAAGGITTSPSSLTFISNPQENTACPILNAPKSFTASESGFSGTFAASSSDTSLATVTSSSSGGFTVTPSSTDKASTAKATITVTDGAGHSGTVAVVFNGNGVCLP